jgi:hypothetical protein
MVMTHRNDPWYAMYIAANSAWFKRQVAGLSMNRPGFWLCPENISMVSATVYELWRMDPSWRPDWKELAKIVDLLGGEIVQRPKASVRKSSIKAGASLKYPKDDFLRFMQKLWALEDRRGI